MTAFKSQGADDPGIRNVARLPPPVDDRAAADGPACVAYIVHTFGVGGLERCVAHLANALDRARFRPLIVCLDRNGTAAPWITRDDVRILEVGKGAGHRLHAIRRLADIFRRERVQIAHSHNWGTLIETVLARRLAGVPWHVHAERGTIGALRTSGWRRRLRTWLTGWGLRRCDRLVAVSESVSHELSRLCRLPSNAFHVIPNGVCGPGQIDLAAVRSRIRRRLEIPGDSILVGSVGRLHPVKNFSLLIDAVARLAAVGADAHVCLVGDGPERESLESQAERLGVAGRLHLPGLQSNVAEWLCAFDVFVNSSVSEGMSQSILEAMAFGLPLVVTDVGANASLVGWEAPCGNVVPPGDADALSRALETLIADPALRASFARSARQRHSQQYSIERMIRTYEDLYDGMLAGSLQRRCPRAD